VSVCEREEGIMRKRVFVYVKNRERVCVCKRKGLCACASVLASVREGLCDSERYKVEIL
jgi:hypothetical protein